MLLSNLNPCKKQEAARERVHNKKLNSDANLLKFEEETQYGPEFVCICCHECHFEKNVFEFTDDKKKKINPDVIEKSCDPKEDIFDPGRQGRSFVCTYCFNFMKTKQMMPNRSIKNGLEIERVPQN